MKNIDSLKKTLFERIAGHALANNHLLAEKSKSSSLGQILLWSIALISTRLSDLSWMESAIWTSLFAVNIFRFILSQWNAKSSRPLAWYLLYASTTLWTAVGCGYVTAFYVLKFEFNSEISILVLIINSGIVAAGTASLSPDKFLARMFVSLCLLPLMLVLSFYTSSTHYEVAAVTGLYLAFLYQQIEIQSNVILGLRAQELQLRSMAIKEQESRQQEQILMQEKDKATRESLVLKSEFLATMSHELRTPLNAIIGSGDLLENLENDSVRLGYIKTIKGSSEALLRLVNDILDFEKIESDRVKIEALPFLVSELFERQIGFASSKVQGKGLSYLLELDPNLPLSLRGDFNRIRQVLTNLMDNAVKFTEKGAVTLRGRLIQNDGITASLRFEVQDTGIGIDSDKGKRLFNPFTQIDGSTSRKYGGTGLGLSICQRLVERMGGVIAFESEVRRGTKFWFDLSLPIVDIAHIGSQQTIGTSIPTTEKLNTPSPFNQERILVVEDNPTNQIITMTMLRRLGLQCEVAPNGRLGFEAWRKSKFDLILMDCHMPEMDGFEATMRIRQDESKNGGHVPILALTANVFESNRERCLQSGMDGFIAKPVRRQMLAEELKKFLDSRAELAS